MEKLVFSLKLEEVPVEMTDENGEVKEYILRGLTSDERSTFLNTTGNRAKFGAKGAIQGLTDYKLLQEGLLTMCMKNELGEKIPAKTLATWPAQVVSALFTAAQTMSGMDLEGEAEAKND